MRLKKIITDYFEFYPTERRGLFAAGVIIFIWAIGLFIYSRTPLVSESDRAFILAVEAHEKLKAQKKAEADSLLAIAQIEVPLFYFNPNKISADSLQLLGLPEQTVKSIVKYREKGGKFRNADELAKIYTLSEDDFNRIYPFVVIDSEAVTHKEHNWNEQPAFKPDTIKRFAKKRPIIELNSADTLELVQVYGIGPYRARSIVKHRDALGGFFRLDQLLEIYKMDTETLDKIEPFITIDSNLVSKININKVTLDNLKKHPYIRYSLANSLVNIRKAHGPYKSLKDLYRSDLMNDSIYKRIRPYIKIND